MEDRSLVDLIKRDSNAGIAATMDKYGGLLAYIVRNTGINLKEDQEECLSDILYTIWRKIAKYDHNRSSFKTWIVLLARGCSVDYVRKNKRTKTLSYDDIDDINLIGNEDNLLDMIDLLQQMKPPDNHIFFNKFVLGESVIEIAEKLKITTDSVYKRISRGREKLKRLLK